LYKIKTTNLQLLKSKPKINFKLRTMSKPVTVTVTAASSNQFNEYSLYIPTINKKYTSDRIGYLFWQFCIGNVDRVDFVPIMKQPKDPKNEPFEDANFRQAFIYIRPGTKWSSIVNDAIEKDGSYRFFPNQSPHPDPRNQGNPKEYWVILKNKSPVPYAQTHLNIHQLAHNNSLLETKVSEMETEMLSMKEEIERLKGVLYREPTSDVARARCDSHSTTEAEAESFVNSWENILRMTEERQGIFRDENGMTEEDRQQMYSVSPGDDDSEQEEELEYDDNGDATPRGRVVKNEDNCHKCAILDVDGYNNGDVAPRGWKLSIEADL